LMSNLIFKDLLSIKTSSTFFEEAFFIIMKFVKQFPFGDNSATALTSRYALVSTKLH
jgi:hypothetical protein